MAAATNSAPAELPVPESIFNLAAQTTKDPFFPLSTRQPAGVTNNAAPAFSVSEFVLKGLSGSAHNRLALINNRTFAVGDTNTITTPSGKINVRCMKIKENSVILRADPQHETTEIFLRKVCPISFPHESCLNDGQPGGHQVKTLM